MTYNMIVYLWCVINYFLWFVISFNIFIDIVSRYPGTISNHVRLNGLVVRAVEEITNCSSTPSTSTSSQSSFHCLKTAKGQTRFLIRAALKHHWLLNICESARTFPDINLFYRQDALMLQESNCEWLISNIFNFLYKLLRSGIFYISFGVSQLDTAFIWLYF